MAKIAKRIRLKSETADLVAFITDNKKPQVYICYDACFYDGKDFDDKELGADQVKKTSQIGEYLLRMPLSEFKKISKVKIK